MSEWLGGMEDCDLYWITCSWMDLTCCSLKRSWLIALLRNNSMFGTLCTTRHSNAWGFLHKIMWLTFCLRGKCCTHHYKEIDVIKLNTQQWWAKACTWVWRQACSKDSDQHHYFKEVFSDHQSCIYLIKNRKNILWNISTIQNKRLIF